MEKTVHDIIEYFENLQVRIELLCVKLLENDLC